VSTIEELLGRKTSGFCLEIREYGRRDVTLTAWHSLSTKVGTNFTDKRRSLGQYRLLVDSGHGVFFSLEWLYLIHIVYDNVEVMRPDEVKEFFSIYLILPAALGPGVYSASNRNEYQNQKNNVSGE
jgi:hypothetical protein